jgi:hypothetical protein
MNANDTDGATRLPALMTLVNTLVSSGFALAGLLTAASVAGGDHEAACTLFAGYAAARSLPLTVAVVWGLVTRKRRELGVLAVTLALVQAADALVGVAAHDVAKTVGPAVFAVLTALGVPALLREAPYRG